MKFLRKQVSIKRKRELSKQSFEMIENKLLIVQLMHTLSDMHKSKDEHYEKYEQLIE